MMPDSEYRKTQVQELLESKLEAVKQEILGAIETLQHDQAHQAELILLLRSDIAALNSRMTRIATAQSLQDGKDCADRREKTGLQLTTVQWLAVLAVLVALAAWIATWYSGY